MNTSLNNNITFLPSATESTPDLKNLFADVHKLIANYLEEHPEADDKTIRRFVAGDVCLEDLAELNDCFVLPKVTAPRVTTWNRFLGEQISSKKRNFNEMNEISEEYNAMKRNRTEEFVLLENKCQQEKQKMLEQQEGDKESISKRNQFYRNDLSVLIKFCDVMYENYKTSILIYGATDSLYPKHYRPFQHANSVLAEQAEKTILNYTQERDLQFIIDDVIGAHGEKALYYKGGNAFPSVPASSSSAIDTKKTDLICPFLEQALLAWKDVTGKAVATRVPWTKIFGNTVNEYAITGWPETILKPIEKNKFEPWNLSKKDLKELTQLFKEKKMKFVRNVINKNRP